MSEFKKRLKVLYVGPLNSGGTCYARLRALEDIEPEVYKFDSALYFETINKYQRALEHRLFMGPQILKANAELKAYCKKINPDIAWIDKGHWIWPSTLRAYKKQGVFLIHHNTDALYPTKPILRWMYLLLRKNIPFYNMHFTTNLQDYSMLSNNKSFQTKLTFLGYDHLRFNNTPLSTHYEEKWHNSILFVGHYEQRTERYIKALVDANLPVTVFGYGWKHAKYKKILSTHVHSQQLSDEDYIQALKGAKIGLCFVSELNGNQTAGRSFEIPACGTFLLAMRTHQHKECYVEGKEAEFFGDCNELIKKARFYLDHDDIRIEIAKRGHERCIGSDYSWARYMRDDWAKVKNAFYGRRS